MTRYDSCPIADSHVFDNVLSKQIVPMNFLFKKKKKKFSHRAYVQVTVKQVSEVFSVNLLYSEPLLTP